MLGHFFGLNGHGRTICFGDHRESGIESTPHISTSEMMRLPGKRVVFPGRARSPKQRGSKEESKARDTAVTQMFGRPTCVNIATVGASHVSIEMERKQRGSRTTGSTVPAQRNNTLPSPMVRFFHGIEFGYRWRT
ncbi:hypothetical protein JB92DRAFT_2997181 [Gautieria morchelliformis]|nr:hypothetical protein JB92DRAFT_2997181 [Gautieria morchelliformis]